MLIIIALKVVMLSGVIQSVVLLIVVAPSFEVCIVTNQAVVNITKPFFFATHFLCNKLECLYLEYSYKIFNYYCVKNVVFTKLHFIRDLRMGPIR
jgi:hypothetical protein